jgi:hypothetical protein
VVVAVLGVRGNVRIVSKAAICAQSYSILSASLKHYTQTHGGRYPDRLVDLVLDGHLEASGGSFVCACGEDTPATGSTNAQFAAEFAKPGHCSYVYLGKGLSVTTNPPQPVLAGPRHRCGLQTAVLFTDGKLKLAGDEAVDWPGRADGSPAR